VATNLREHVLRSSLLPSPSLPTAGARAARAPPGDPARLAGASAGAPSRRPYCVSLNERAHRHADQAGGAALTCRGAQRLVIRRRSSA
jgi:hypothetical protein